MLGSILLVASLALPSIATAPTYFTFNSVAAALPDNLYDTSNGASIEIEITDPATKTSTKCIKKWQPEATFYGPADWMACTDPTFSFRFNNFVNITEWTVGVRHQYRGNGKPCLKSNGPQCVTRLGYGTFDSSVPGYTSDFLDDASSSSEAMSVEQFDTAGTSSSYPVPVYQSCTACATNKLGSC